MPTLLINSIPAVNIEDYTLRQPVPRYTRYTFSGSAPGYEHSGYSEGSISIKGDILDHELFSDSLFNARHEITISDERYIYALHDAFFIRYSYDYSNAGGEYRICKIDCDLEFSTSSFISQPNLKIDHLEFKVGVVGAKKSKKKKVKPKLNSRNIVIFRK